MYKSHNCGELGLADVGKEVSLAGWVDRLRDLGGVNFIDLRDRSGVVQIVSDPERSADVHQALTPVRTEWVIKVVGVVQKRPEGMENLDLATGEIEVEIKQVEILNPAKTPPFLINQEEEVEEQTRLKYRYLDLRRPRMRDNIILRHKIVAFIRNYLGERDFIEVETPILFKTTPEGARDYIVPSRVHPGASSSKSS